MTYFGNWNWADAGTVDILWRLRVCGLLGWPAVYWLPTGPTTNFISVIILIVTNSNNNNIKTATSSFSSSSLSPWARANCWLPIGPEAPQAIPCGLEQATGLSFKKSQLWRAQFNPILTPFIVTLPYFNPLPKSCLHKTLLRNIL